MELAHSLSAEHFQITNNLFWKLETTAVGVLLRFVGSQNVFRAQNEKKKKKKKNQQNVAHFNLLPFFYYYYFIIQFIDYSGPKLV